jgi:hypothetical protein
MYLKRWMMIKGRLTVSKNMDVNEGLIKDL